MSQIDALHCLANVAWTASYEVANRLRLNFTIQLMIHSWILQLLYPRQMGNGYFVSIRREIPWKCQVDIEKLERQLQIQPEEN